jgi:hypothetical protein
VSARADIVFLAAAALVAVAQMLLGNWPGLALGSDPLLHLGLFGWLALALSGIAYASFPGLARGRLTWLHAGLLLPGAALLVPGIVLAQGGGSPVPTLVGAALTVLGMGVLATAVMRHVEGR